MAEKIDASKVKWDEAINPEAVAWDSPKSESPVADRAKRVAGLGARSLIRGATAIPTLMAEAVAAPLRMATGGQYFQSPSAVLERTMTQAGLPEPGNATERFATNITSAMGGVGSQLGLLNALRPSSVAGEGIRQTLMQQPRRQLVASGTGVASAQTAAELGAGPVGQTAAGMAGSMLPFVPQAVFPKSPEQIVQARTAQDARELGYRLPPTQAGGGPVNATLEGWIAGKAPTDRTLSIKNQDVTNAAVKRDLGIPETQAITPGILKGIRERAGADYRAIKSIKQFDVDDTFVNRIRQLTEDERALATEAPSVSNTDILKQAAELERGTFSGNAVIALTQRLREKAKSAFKAGDTGAGQFYRNASDSIEDLVERNLERTGQTELLPAWRTARQTIAKAHTAESALNESTGNIDASVIARQFDNRAPLSGPMRTIGQTANTYGNAMRLPENVGMPAGRDVLGAMAGAGAIPAAAQNPQWLPLALLPPVRPIVRSLITSRPYQALMVNPNAAPVSQGDAALLGLLSGVYGQQQ